MNVRVLSKPEPTGVSRYTYKLLSALTKRNDDVKYILFGIESVPEELQSNKCPIEIGSTSPDHSGLRAHSWEQLTLPREISKHDLDVFHTPAGQPPILSKVPQVTTIHDISPITHPEWFSRKYAFFYRTLTPLAVRVSNQITTVSNFARDEIESQYSSANEKTVSIYNGVEPPQEETKPVDQLKPGNFLISVGAASPRKNLKRLVQSYSMYRNEVDDPVPLALVGPTRDVLATTNLPEVDGVRALGFVTDEELAWLYNNATALVYPSLYEGFGLPILESMSVGTPVITSNCGAMAEVAGDAAQLVDPSDTPDIAQGIEQVVKDATLRNELRERGRDRASEFTWERTARETIEVYRSVIQL